MTGIEVRLKNDLGDFTLDVEFGAPGQGVTALFGRSGSGKTSILRSVAGLVKTATGLVKVGEDIWQDESQFIAPHERPIGYVFQEASLFPHLSVRRNLEYGWRRIPRKQRRIKLATVVELLGIGHLLKRYPHRLSGGERQRVGIGRALLTSPRLLLMDEPLSALDHGTKQNILPYLENLHDEFAIPSLYVSHDPNEVARLADHLIFLEQGRVAAVGPAADMLTRLDLPVAGWDDATAILEGTVASHDPTFHLTWISMDAGRIAVSRESLPIGKRARVEICARDVSLALNAHSDTSIVNILPATVVDTQDIDPCQLLVRLQLEDGQHLLSRITRHSGAALGIHEGQQLYAQVKSVALIP